MALKDMLQRVKTRLQRKLVCFLTITTLVHALNQVAEDSSSGTGGTEARRGGCSRNLQYQQGQSSQPFQRRP